MRPALVVVAYAVAVAWLLPAPLARLTERGVRPGLGLIAWLAAMVSVLACGGAALAFLIRGAVAGWPGLAEAVCRSVAGAACAPTLYRSALFELALAAVAIAAALTALALAWRYGRGLRRAHRSTRAHGEAARITGRPAARLAASRPAGRLAAGRSPVVLDAPERAAYCVPGRPATIVLTSGALAVLEPAQLAAVLAHEEAHLAGRHHLLIGLTRVLAVCCPVVPLFSRGAAQVARLAEMRADDAAVRRSGRRTLVAALLAMGTGMAVPAAALAATGGAVAARVQRLLEPPRRVGRLRNGLALVGVTVLLAVVSAAVTVVAGALSARGIPTA